MLKGLTLLEFLIALFIIILLFGFFGAYAGDVVRVAREEALRNELQNLRLSVAHYYLIFQQFPAQLRDLQKKELTSKAERDIIQHNNFIEHGRIDQEGDFLDPFFYPYNYEAKSGRVNSASKGYESW
jgi:type II secretory pathway pseudopilin PulG